MKHDTFFNTLACAKAPKLMGGGKLLIYSKLQTFPIPLFLLLMTFAVLSSCGRDDGPYSDDVPTRTAVADSTAATPDSVQVTIRVTVDTTWHYTVTDF